jgi:predicted metalloprotease with PDZ domain/peroxiredoxin
VTLQEQLDEYQRHWQATNSQGRVKLYDDFIAELRKSGVGSQTPKVGQPAPLFVLPDGFSEQVALADLLTRGPVVVLWCRGGWDAYDTIALRTYAEALPRIRELGATLVAISPQTPDNSLLTQQLGQFEFDLLSDAGNQVARKYGLVYKLSEKMAIDLRSQVDLREYNGDDSQELPLPATFVINCDDVVRFAFVDPDFRKRAAPEDVLAILKALQSEAEETPEAEKAPEAASHVRLSYELTLQPAAEQKADVVARFEGLAPDCAALPLKMAEGWAFVRLPEPLLNGPVQATADGQPLAIERTAPYTWTVKPAGHTRIELRYSVPLAQRDLEAVRGRDEFEYPFVAPDHALLPTATLIVCPAECRPEQIRVRLNVPPGWDVCAPWPQLPTGEFDPGTTDALENDLLALGRWNRHEIRVGDFVGTIAFAPGQAEIEDAAADVIGRIVQHELQLFGRPATGRYLFLFGPPAERGMSGSPKTHSMVLAVDPKMHDRGVRHLAHLIAHEFFHTWAHSIGELPDELRWLNEGVTDYYAYLVSARLGFLTWEQFADMLAENMLTATNNRHYGQTSLVEAGGPAFFTDTDTYDLVYAGGLLCGAWLDRAIRAEGQGQSLDDFMRALLNDPRWAPNQRGPAMADFVRLLPRFVSADLARRAEQAVCEPYSFDPVAAFPPLGVAVTPKTGATNLDLRANLDGTRIVDIDHRNLAYRIGLRESDRLLEVNGQPVTTPTEVHTAWGSPQNGRVRATLQRGEERTELNEPLPAVLGYEVAAEPWHAHAAGNVVLANDVVVGED